MKKAKLLLAIASATLLNNCVSVAEFTVPPGTDELNSQLYIDKFPISNLDYQEFLNSLQSFWTPNISEFLHELPEYGLKTDVQSAPLPPYSLSLRVENDSGLEIFRIQDRADTSFINDMTPPLDSMIFNKVSLETYLTHPAYRSYPAIYITAKQAEAYCKWRTDVVNYRIALLAETQKDYSQYPAPLQYRLPTPGEWLMAAAKADSMNTGVRMKEKTSVFRTPIRDNYLNYNKRNKYHFYYQAGVLWEILAEEQTILYGITEQDAQDTSDTSYMLGKYETASPVQGFRCICEVRKL